MCKRAVIILVLLGVLGILAIRPGPLKGVLMRRDITDEHIVVDMPSSTVIAVDYDSNDDQLVFLPVSTGLVSELTKLEQAELEQMPLLPVPMATPVGSG